MKILFVVHASPNSGAISTLVNTAKIARGRGHEVSVFIMGKGVLNLTREDFIGLISDDVQITACEHSREKLGAPGNVDGVLSGSQYDLSVMANEYDRVISFIRG
ncbi:MAG TPA: DsrE family protein [Nitrospinota bacterium]|jgi:hypothetical protein|nr:DsrE family protein [Nitrospinota bacterium]|tara:strand:- start:254641 stop:254952 length:312 start_codon:yes stop_codon:yes gene_type:complete